MDLAPRIATALAYAARLEREAVQLRHRSAVIRERAVLLRARADEVRQRSAVVIERRRLGRALVGGHPPDLFVNRGV